MKVKENKYIKVGAVSPKIRLADVETNVKACVAEAKRAAEMGARVLVFPELTLTGATCGDLFRQPALIERAERGLAEYIDATKELDIISFIGLPARIDDGCYNCTAVVYCGELLGVATNRYLSNDKERYFDTSSPHVRKIHVGGYDSRYLRDNVIALPFANRALVCIGLSGPVEAKGVKIAICQDAIEYVAGDRTDDLLIAREVSGYSEISCVFANAGIGESTTDAVYAAHNIISDNGEILAEALPFASDNLILADVSLDNSSVKNAGDFDEDGDDEDGDTIPANPFLPTEPSEQKEVCLEALEIQSQGLAARIERSYSKAMVIGVSGGLDSTLALLVCARAADILGMDRKNIIGVTMPCFGTTNRTKSNAEKLCEALGVSFRTVDIKASVTQHLKDIGHDGVTTDVTYENAQARERTQVLMDIANMVGGLVVGTGDLSELVLGWATYNGDHMSMYAVNASVPKTMVRRIVEVYSEHDRANGGACADILDDILATPVSPELLPPRDGEIAQCTEALVGPYELHDFFIYCTLNLEMSLHDTYACAKTTFDGVYDNKTILGWLRVFARRFISQQFKRSCLPDGPRVSCISVSPRGGLSMPSDASAAAWLGEIDEIERTEMN